MGISLTPETQKLLEEKLKQGSYPSADELVHAALGALEECEADPLDAETLSAIDRAEAQIDRGECRDWTQVRQELHSRYFGK